MTVGVGAGGARMPSAAGPSGRREQPGRGQGEREAQPLHGREPFPERHGGEQDRPHGAALGNETHQHHRHQPGSRGDGRDEQELRRWAASPPRKSAPPKTHAPVRPRTAIGIETEPSVRPVFWSLRIHAEEGTLGTRWARFTRGWVVAGFSLFVAALSHNLGGGAAPGMLAVVLSLAFAGVVCVGLTGTALSLWRVSVSVLASQLIFHGLFSLGGAGSAAGRLYTDAATPGSAHDHTSLAGLALGGLADADGGLAAGAHPAEVHGTLMWLAHGVAALVTIAALRHGERAFWSLLAGARLNILFRSDPVATPAVMPAVPRRTPTTAPVFSPRDLWVLLSTRPHRGPPRSLRAA